MTTDRHERRALNARRAFALIGLLIVALLIGSGDVRADEKDDLKREADAEIERLRQERKELEIARAVQAAAVDATTAEFEEITAALDTLNAHVTAAEQRVEAAKQAVEDAGLALDSIEQQEAFVQEEKVLVEEGLQDLAVGWYVNGRDTESTTTLTAIDTESPTEAAVKAALFKVRIGQEVNLVDRLHELTDDLGFISDNRARALKEATGRGVALELTLAELESAREIQQTFAIEVEERLDARLAEAAALAAVDAELAQEIRNEQIQLVAKIREIERKEELARRAAQVPSIVGTGEIVSVGGVRVHRSISDNVLKMFNAARADGIHLGGGGYRSSSSQIALRRAHCGRSDYEVYNKPAATCRPPTARPGHSMHERGLAIDFTANGRAIISRNTDAFQWLAKNAAKYGFYNLPSEPWHWSTTGR